MGQFRTQLSVALGVVALLGAAAHWLTSEGTRDEVDIIAVPAGPNAASNASASDQVLVEVSPRGQVGVRSAVELTDSVSWQVNAPLEEQPATDLREPSLEGVFSTSVAIQLYVHGEPSAALLDGSVPVSFAYRRRRSSLESAEVTIPVESGRFEVEVRRRADGVLTTMDGGHELGDDLERLELKVAVPQVEGMGPLLLFNTATGNPWHYGPRIAFGAEDAVIPVCEAPSVELDVLEKGTNRHLESVSVIVEGRVFGGPESAAKRLASYEPSPLQLTPGAPESLTESVKLRVEAAGYGGKPMTIDFRRAGKRVIELEPAGQLTVYLEGDIHADAEISLFSTGAQQSRELEGSKVTFEDLTPGQYVVQLTLGEFDSRAPTQGMVRGTVTVVEGELAELTLTVPDAQVTQLATLRGTLVFPKGWSPTSKQMVVKMAAPGQQATTSVIIPSSQMKAVPGRSDEFTFEIESLAVGSYVFSLPALQLDFPVDVPPGGLHDARFVVPRPVRVTVLTRAAAGFAESDARVPQVSWRPMLPGGVFSSSSKSVKPSGGSHRFSIQVPAGTIQVFTNEIGWSSQPLEFTAVDGLEVVLEVKPSASFSVELRDGQRVLPWPPHEAVKILAIGGAEAGASDANSMSLQVSSTRPKSYVVAEPGVYEITIPTIDGYLPHDNVVVTLKRGPKQKVVVQLTPR